MGLETFWFIVVAVFWTGFLVLEGFDFGVGVLHALIGRTTEERRAAVATIGPFWDGNEVWLIVAVAAMFAAFPGWYASTFSALYIPTLVVLVALILRGVSFEYAERLGSARWHTIWTWALVGASALVPLIVGLTLGDLLVGLPIDGDGNFTGGLLDLVTPFGLWVGLTFLVLSMLQGTVFLTLRSTGIVHARARRLAGPMALVAIAVVAVFVVWSHVVADGGVVPGPIPVLGVLAVVAAAWAVRDRHEALAFTCTSGAIVASVATLFIDLYPNVLVSSTGTPDLTVAGTASGSYALTVMTVVAVVLVPVVLLYQGWTYWVFRRRITGPPEPVVATGGSATGPAEGQSPPWDDNRSSPAT